MARIRIYSPYFPYPHTEAAFQLIFNQIVDCQSLGHTVELVTWKDSPELLAKKQNQCGPLWPDGVPVTSFYAGTTNGFADRVGRVLRSLWSSDASPELFYYPLAADRRETLAPTDLEIYHYSFAHPWLKKSASHATKTVVCFENLEHQLFHLRATEEGGLRAVLHRRTARRLKEHEKRLSALVDEIWQVSPADLEDYQKLFGPANQRLVPPSIRQAAVQHRWSTPLSQTENVYRLGFIGGLNFVPNQESFRWILNHLAPLIESQSGARFEIIHVGKRDPEIEAQARRYPFVKFLGFVEDVESWWSTLSYSMIPDTTGAGIRVKLLESLGSKVPVLANRRAVERIPSSLHREPGLSTSDDPQAWMAKILSSAPLEERRRLRERPFPPGLDGLNIYSFLNEAYIRE